MLSFCEKCRNLLKHQVIDGVLVMQCHVCLHISNVKSMTVYSDDYRPLVTDQYPVHADLCLDSSLARTLKMPCPNPECPSKDGSRPPEVVLFHYNSDYTQGYICCACHSFWKQVIHGGEGDSGMKPTSADTELTTAVEVPENAVSVGPEGETLTQQENTVEGATAEGDEEQAEEGTMTQAGEAEEEQVNAVLENSAKVQPEGDAEVSQALEAQIQEEEEELSEEDEGYQKKKKI